MNLAELNRIGRIDAALILEYLRSMDCSVFPAQTFENIASALNSSGLTTGRGSLFTARVVRENIDKLEECGALIRSSKRGSCEFCLTLLKEFSDVPCSENGIGNVDAEIENDHNKEYINIYPKINKQILKLSNSISDEHPAPERKDDNDDRDGGRAENVNDVVARTDFTADKVARFRKRVARDVYEAGLHADLVDRAVAAVVNRIATVHELQAAIRESRDEVRLLQTTNGFRGKRRLWETFCKRVKSWFDGAGVRWTPTSSRREPEPEALIATHDDSFEERILAQDAAIRARTASMFRPMRRAACSC